MKNKKLPGTYILMSLLLFLSSGGFFGGIVFLFDPTGGYLKMSPELISRTPFGSYIIPAFLLIIFFGVFPLITFWGLLKKPAWKYFDLLNIYTNVHWSWTYSLYCGIILVIWMDFEIMFLGYHEFIQTFYSLFGVAVIIMTLIPGMKEHYALINKE